MSETIKNVLSERYRFFCAIFWVANLTDAIANERPNIVIILADDLGWADVGYHGSDIETPNIDRIAKEGVKLNRFYATPFCSPTRAALMTGRDPLKLGVAYSVLMPWENGGVSLDEHFLPQSFQSAGYNTAMVGKWHLGHTIEQHTPNARDLTISMGICIRRLAILIIRSLTGMTFRRTVSLLITMVNMRRMFMVNKRPVSLLI